MDDMRTDVWLWAALALLLIAAETLAPGVFLMWLGFAATAMLGLVLLVPGIAPLWQAVMFIALSFLSIAAYRHWFQKDIERESDHPTLNRKGAQLIGRVFVLEQAIVDGQGRIKDGDALWTVLGPDLPQGRKVRVIAVDSMRLQVQTAD